MKKIIINIMALLLCSLTYGQGIKYQKSFNTALDKALTEKKLVLVIVTAPIPKSGPPGVTNFVYRTGLDDSKVIDYFNKNFIPFTALVTDSAATSFRNKYKLTTFPSYLFIDGHNNLVYKETGNAVIIDKFLNMGEKALTMQSSGKTISNYEAQYLLGNKSADFLKEYITLKENMSVYDNAKLIDDYVDQLTIKSFQDYNEVLFILKAGPYAYGKAFNLCYTNRKITDSIYKTEPLATRSAINQRIIANTADEAIRRKDANMAQQAANYTSNTWRNSNPRQGVIASQSQMLFYYSSIKDTAAFYRQASYFYDNFYMNISADSARKKQLAIMENLKKAALSHYPATDTTRTVTTSNNGVKTVTRTISVGQTVTTGSTNSTAMTLNNAAYQFYTLGTYNPNYLSKAILWSKRSIELEQVYAYYDTLAHLLYRIGFFDEALSMQTKAVNLAETTLANKTAVDNLKLELNKIKTRKLN